MNSIIQPIIICLTPVRNEAWILDKFLTSTSLWADHIIIADQMSTDGSREIAKKYPKVILIDNPSETFNEPERQKLLIDEARKIEGQRLLITLDADEVFTPNYHTSEEWKTMLTSNPGTIFRFYMYNLSSDLKNMWLHDDYFFWGYMDDGYQHKSDNIIHTARIPLPQGHDIINNKDIKVIHFQFTDWNRMQSKHRWYQCFEVLNFKDRSALDIFRMYHHMYGVKPTNLIPIPKEWIEDYKKQEIDLLHVNYETKLWWDEKVLDLFEEHGTEVFRKLNIWGVNWKKTAKSWGKSNLSLYNDPRNIFDKLIQFWLLKTQKIKDVRNVKRIEKRIKKYFHY